LYFGTSLFFIYPAEIRDKICIIVLYYDIKNYWLAGLAMEKVSLGMGGESEMAFPCRRDI
jgi:hypothetical protein